MIQQSNSPQEQENIKKKQKLFQQYKKRLLFQVILVLFICFCVIIQRIFYQIIISNQDSTLSSLQQQLGLSDNYQPTAITNSGFKIISYLGFFKIQFLIFTHIIATMYVSINAIIASKLLYMSILVLYFMAVVQMFYGGQRPFWDSQNIFTSNCLSSYNHPSRGTIFVSFVVAYGLYCFETRIGKGGKIKSFDLKNLLLKGAIFLTLLGIQIFAYILGQQYLINIALGIVYFITILMIIAFLNSYIDTAIKKSTIMSIEAKKYSFYWLLYLSIAQTFALIVYTGQNQFVNIDWIQNYMQCGTYLNQSFTTLRYDQIVGPWYTFLQTDTIFGLIGAVFGIAYCFRNMSNLQWYGGNKKNKWIRILITNLLIIPSWLFIIFLQGQQGEDTWIKKLGINDFIVDGIHFFSLYLWIFGYMPVLIFEKLLKVTNKDNEQYYIVLNENEKSEN